MSAPKVGTFKGHPYLTLNPNDTERPFSFGIKKAMLILKQIEAIRQFVKDEGWTVPDV